MGSTIAEDVRSGTTDVDGASGAVRNRNEPETERTGPPTGAHTEHGSSVIAQLRHLQQVLRAVRPERARFVAALTDAVCALPADTRKRVIAQLVRELPELRAMPEFLDAAAKLGIQPEELGSVSVRHWVEQLTGKTVGSAKVTDGAILRRLAAVLRALADAYADLRRTREDLIRGMGLPPGGGPADGEQWLAALLDFSVDGDEQLAAVTGVFADAALQPLALLRGVTEGVRGLLEQLSPQAIDEIAGQARRKNAFARLLPPGTGRKWHAFVRKHRDLCEHDGFFREVFGSRFLRAYCAVTNGGPPETVDG